MQTTWLGDFFERIKYPVAICNGGHMEQFELAMEFIFESDGVPFTHEDNLYHRDDYDLSKYKTIVFDTKTSINSQTQKIFSFDKSNLELVIVGEPAFFKIKDMIKELKIDCLVFRYPEHEFIDPFVRPSD
ncbi:MAG TPA: hypothetical protein VL576_00165 [Candidatus Paceibacterota bacterium]|jgi:hypothetical protein|nr:hypothetical protein [Candidatus Paceibacterota bacterium]